MFFSKIYNKIVIGPSGVGNWKLSIANFVAVSYPIKSQFVFFFCSYSWGYRNVSFILSSNSFFVVTLLCFSYFRRSSSTVAHWASDSLVSVLQGTFSLIDWLIDWLLYQSSFVLGVFVVSSAPETSNSTEIFLGITLEGGNYDPVFWKLQLARALSYLKIVVIAVVALGVNPFPSLGMATPRFFDWAVSNKVLFTFIMAWDSMIVAFPIFPQIYACLMSWFLTGMVENALMSTGAFEVFYNGTLLSIPFSFRFWVGKACFFVMIWVNFIDGRYPGVVETGQRPAARVPRGRQHPHPTAQRGPLNPFLPPMRWRVQIELTFFAGRLLWRERLKAVFSACGCRMSCLLVKKSSQSSIHVVVVPEIHQSEIPQKKSNFLALWISRVRFSVRRFCSTEYSSQSPGLSDYGHWTR